MDALIVSPVLPTGRVFGQSIATRSDVQAFRDIGMSVGVFAYTHNNAERVSQDDCPTVATIVKSGGFGARFVRGLKSPWPPSIERFYHVEAEASLRRCLVDWNPTIVVIDDISVGGWIDLIREVRPQAKVVVRSMNVMADVRQAHLNRLNFVTKFAVRLELARYIEFERGCLAACDAHWAITAEDGMRMTELYGVPSEHLPVALPLAAYTTLPLAAGGDDVFVHIGSIDYRRMQDFRDFMAKTWDEICRINTNAKLLLAGEMQSQYIPTSPNVEVLGIVKDDVAVYRKGRYSVNFQTSTGGLKIKSLTSLAAGRILLSTTMGVEGMPVEHGVHFLNIQTLLATGTMADAIADSDSLRMIAQAGRDWVCSNHSGPAVARQLAKLIGPHRDKRTGMDLASTA